MFSLTQLRALTQIFNFNTKTPHSVLSLPTKSSITFPFHCPVNQSPQIWHFFDKKQFCLIRTGIQGSISKLKWKSLMEFSMKGGPRNLSFFNFFCLKTSRITPWLSKSVLHLVWALWYVYIVVTLNRAECGSQRSDKPEMRMSILNQL